MEDIYQVKEGLEYLQNEVEALKSANDRYIAIQQGLQNELASMKFLVDEMKNGNNNNIKNNKLAPSNFTMKCLKYMQTIKLNKKKRKSVVQFLGTVERAWQVYVEETKDNCTEDLKTLFVKFTKDIDVIRKRHFFNLSSSNPFQNPAPYLPDTIKAEIQPDSDSDSHHYSFSDSELMS